MYRPESSHLIRFLELSSLTLQLAPRGGSQGKSGYLRVLSTNVSLKKDRPALRLIAQIKQREPKWWIVRESYMVAVEDPDEVHRPDCCPPCSSARSADIIGALSSQTKIFDVFMFDQDFTIERPNRVLRKTIGKADKFQHDHDWANMTGEDDGGEENRLAALEGDIHGVDRATLDEKNSGKNVSHHTFYVKNSQNRLKLVAKNVRQMQQFIVSLEKMAADSVWAGKNRFDSFAPIRLNVAAQWLVDGRDYLWNLSRALLLAKRTVYIHDWWLSPELYMRRPTQEKYRLDNILKKKAEEGVQIYVIVYNEVSNKTTPTDSLYVGPRRPRLGPTKLTPLLL
jgi:phospholipase D1/2